MDFEFTWQLPDENLFQREKVNSWTFWVPTEDPQMRDKERRSFLYKNQVVKELSLAMPATFHCTKNGAVECTPCPEMGKYALIASLRGSHFLAFYKQVSWESKQIQRLPGQEISPFFYNAFAAPHYGSIAPEYFLFEEISYLELLEKMALRPIEEMMILARLKK